MNEIGRTVFALLDLLGEELLDLLREVLLDAEHDADAAHDDGDRHEAQPEGLLEHALRQGLVRDPQHPGLAALTCAGGQGGESREVFGES